MATVQTNDKLMERTQMAADRYSRIERKRLDEVFMRSVPDDGDMIYRKLVGEQHIAWTKQAPVGMLDVVAKLNIAAISGNEIGMEFPLAISVPSPAKQMGFPSGFIESGFRSVSVNLDGTHENWEAYLEPAQALHTKRKNLQDNIRNLHQFVRMLYREHASLGPCLRMWPPLWDLLHSDDRARQQAKPYGAALPIPDWIKQKVDPVAMTAFVIRIKMQAQ